EGIGLDDIRAGLQILGVNLLDDLRLCKKEQFETAFEIFALPVAKPFSSIIRLWKFVLLDHGAHGAIENDDAFAQERFQWMETVCCHDRSGTKWRFLGESRNKLTHHDA